MRRRIALLVTATASLVLVAFLVPLALLVRAVAADRAVGAATQEAEGVAPLVATVDRDALGMTLEQVARDNAQDFPLTVFLPDGTFLGSPAPRSEAVRLAQSGRSVTAVTDGGREILVAAQGTPGGTAVVRTFVSDARLHAGVSRAWLILGLLGLGLLVLGVVVADWLARGLVRPIAALAGVAHRLAEGDLAARVEPDGPREIRDVGAGLNLLAGRIGELLVAERESVADISHRLRTPLTVLRLDAEALRDPQMAARLADDVAALERTVDEVIREARRPMREGVAAACDATEVVRERVAFWSALAEEEGRRVTSVVPQEQVPVRVAREDLSACLNALLGNVFAHTPEGTAFSVRLEPRPPGAARLVVADEGPGLPEGMSALARGESGGNSTGLGLDIVRRTAEASGGGVLLGHPPDGGAEVSVELGPPQRRPAAPR